jgi:dihydrofolate reductase
MTKVRVAGFSVSIDGFGAGIEQGLTQPLGKDGMELMQWVFPTRTFRAMHGDLEGGTVFHFVTEGIEVAMQRARQAAGELDIKIGGGVDTVRQYLRAGHVDEILYAVSPVVLGRGEAVFNGIDLRGLGTGSANTLQPS